MGSDCIGDPCHRCVRASYRSEKLEHTLPLDTTRRIPYIHTWSGKQFFYGTQDTEVYLPDIAAQLAQQTRFTGATKKPYWIAQHAVVVANILEEWGCDALTALYGLHHDDHEFCTSDLATPFQIWLTDLNGGRNIVEEAKTFLDNLIFPRLDLPWPPHPGIWEIVKMADASAFICEAEQLFANKPNWTQEYVERKKVRRVDMPIPFVSSCEAHMLFLETHSRLWQKYKPV